MMIPFYWRKTNRNNQICLPKEYMKKLNANSPVVSFKVRCVPARKQIILELF